MTVFVFVVTFLIIFVALRAQVGLLKNQAEEIDHLVAENKKLREMLKQYMLVESSRLTKTLKQHIDDENSRDWR